MKSKFTSLLLLTGAVLAAFTDIPIPTLVVAIVGGFLLGLSIMFYTAIYGGKIWGIRIKSDASGKIKQLIGTIGLVIGGYSILTTGLSAFIVLLEGEVISVLIYVIWFAISLVIGSFIGKVVLEKGLAKGNRTNVFNGIPLFQEIDESMGQAQFFVVSFEGVALYSSTNYCYAVYLYENYELGALSTPAEVALIGTYFVEKYHKDFTAKVDTEVIPGTPGQTVVSVGTGGIGVARIQGTPDKRIFRSYIFTRKK